MNNCIHQNPTKGSIFHLKNQENVDPVLFKQSDLDSGAMGHPVLILQSNERKRTAVLYIITSHSGKTLIERFPDKPARRAKINKQRRLEYLPIHPSPPHPDTGKLLRLENHSMGEMKRRSSVKIVKAYAVHWDLLDPYRTEQRSSFKIDSNSWNMVCSNINAEDIVLLKRWAPVARPPIHQCRNPSSASRSQVIDITSVSSLARSAPSPYSYRETPPPIRMPREHIQYSSYSDTETQPLIRPDPFRRHYDPWRPVQRTSIRESAPFRFLARFITGSWDVLCKYRIVFPIISLILIWKYGLIGKGAHLLWLGSKNAAWWLGSTTWEFTKWLGTNLWVCTKWLGANLWELVKGCGRWIGEKVASLWSTSGAGDVLKGAIGKVGAWMRATTLGQTSFSS